MQHLTPTPPYSFSLSLKRLLDMPRQVVTRVEPGPVFVRALDQGAGRLGLVRVREEGLGLAVTVAGSLDPTLALATVRRAFGMDLDLAAFVRHVEGADPIMAGLTLKYSGARPIGPFSLWESLAWAIIAQQVNISFAFALKEALIRLAGRTYEGYPAFPDPEAVAALRYEDLQAERYSRRKAEYVIDIARAIVGGDLDLDRLAALPFEEAAQALVRVRGVGRWTAECLLMDAGVMEAFPADDIGIRNAVRQFYGLDHQPTADEVRTIGRPWVPYGALACFYLWLGLLDKE